MNGVFFYHVAEKKFAVINSAPLRGRFSMDRKNVHYIEHSNRMLTRPRAESGDKIHKGFGRCGQADLHVNSCDFSIDNRSDMTDWPRTITRQLVDVATLLEFTEQSGHLFRPAFRPCKPVVLLRFSRSSLI